jgi:uncharacterized lipoprotein YmbA
MKIIIAVDMCQPLYMSPSRVWVVLGDCGATHATTQLLQLHHDSNLLSNNEGARQTANNRVQVPQFSP